MALPKITFNNLGHSGKPDLKALYGILLMPSYGRVSVTGYATTWPTASSLPTNQWYIDFAAQIATPTDYWLILDIETFAVSTQAERIATSAKFVTMYNAIKALRPELKIGFYQYPIIRDFYNAVKATNHVDYIDWQSKNTDFATMAAVVDGYFPSIYSLTGTTPLENGIDYFYIYAHAQILECKRLRTTYGNASQGIYPYTYWLTDLSATLPRWVYEEASRTAYTEADGITLFGGSTHTWTEATEHGSYDSWWVNFLAQWPYGSKQLLKPRTVRT